MTYYCYIGTVGIPGLKLEMDLIQNVYIASFF